MIIRLSRKLSEGIVPQSWFSLVYRASFIFFLSGCTLCFCSGAPRYTHSFTPADSQKPAHEQRGEERALPEVHDVSAVSYHQTGNATYYGNKFHGRKTASGERYDRSKFTAAHKTLPFGTMVRVTRLSNGKSVTVRVNDRGPLKAGRIIDLSRAAAEAIGMVADGVVKVSIEIVE